MMQRQKYFHPVIDALGGPRHVARWIKVNPSSVTLWAKSGNIPTKHHRKLLDLADARGVKIGAGDWSVANQR